MYVNAIHEKAFIQAADYWWEVNLDGNISLWRLLGSGWFFLIFLFIAPVSSREKTRYARHMRGDI